MAYLIIFFGGGLGSVCRYILDRWLNAGVSEGDMPWGTLLANIVACILLGLGFALISQGRMTEEARLLVLTGFCGGFSTFSTFSLEVLEIGTSTGRPATALLYVALSLAGGLLAIWIGKTLVA